MAKNFSSSCPIPIWQQAIEAMQRLQRDLTKKFFLHNNERILVTFSAGVALRRENEDSEDLIGRADKAMYKAKQTGKNRVVAAMNLIEHLLTLFPRSW